jgi:hypothetical protein
MEVGAILDVALYGQRIVNRISPWVNNSPTTTLTCYRLRRRCFLIERGVAEGRHNYKDC